ncbi:MAG: Ku protein [Gammaproteobacteria bacterium]
MSRPIWKGYITFGLVNIPVILYSGEKKFDIQFKLLDSRDKSRIRYVRINEHTGEEVAWEDVAKGYEYDDNNYVLFNEKELKELAGEHSKTIDIENFINANSLDCIVFDKPYFLVPDKKGDKGYVLLRETLTNTKKVGIAKVIIHTREYLAALMPYENALILNLLHYPQEIKKPSEFELPTATLKKYKISAKELEIAKQLVDSMTTKWNPNAYHDEYRKALEKFIEEKIHHEKPKKSKAKKSSLSKSSNVINFVDLLKKSLKDKKIKKPTKKNPKRKSS